MPRNRNRSQKEKNKNAFRRSKEEWENLKTQNPELGKPKGYKLGPKSNAAFEKYYQGIGIITEEEWLTFLSTMRKPLPTTFRITGSRSQSLEMLKIIKGQYFSKFISTEGGDSRIIPKSFPWYPDQMAWQLDFTKKQIKNDSTLKSLHGFLISETESGNISRQEAVSMLPPLLMAIEPHHKILDMCAAPGSKTAQLIEMLHSDESIPIPDGFVVANDMDNKRCYLMTHQVKRIQSPNCMIINHDARILPNMVTSKNENADFLKYDRILCDVPCSGDGTMRKNPDIWNKWHVNSAYNLHRIQKKVLQRGLEMLAVGGRLVYSTCSLNPVEDEAVIFALIKQCGGAVELMDVSDKLPGLKYCKGTYTWRVLSKSGEWYSSLEQAPQQFKDNWDSTIYPPELTAAQEAKLDRCIRVLPHQQDTGAFFIAVFQKLQELPWVSARSKTKKLDPVINPKRKLDGQEPKWSETDPEHFTFGIRSNSGLYSFAKCTLCNIILQGKSDYVGHKVGKKHSQQLADLLLKTDNKQNDKKLEKAVCQKAFGAGTNTDTCHSESVAMETEKFEKELIMDTDVDDIKDIEITAAFDNVNESCGNAESKDVVEVLHEATSDIIAYDILINGKNEKELSEGRDGEACPPAKKQKLDANADTEIQKLDADADTVIQKLDADADTVIQKLDADADTEIQKLDADADTEIQKLDSSADTEIQKLDANADTEIQKLDADADTEVQKLDADADTEIRVVLQGHREDPFYFCLSTDPVWPSVKKFYDISDDNFSLEQLMYRNMKRVLYFVSKPIRNLVICNDDKIKFISLGVKCFSNAPSPLVPQCDYRLSQEGLLAIHHCIRARRVMMTKQDVVIILSQENPFFYKLSLSAQETVNAMVPGSALFHYKPTESDPEPNIEIVFCGWRGKTSVRSFVSKDERCHYLRMFGVELSDIQSKVKEIKATREKQNLNVMPSATGSEALDTEVPSGNNPETDKQNEQVEGPVRNNEENSMVDQNFDVEIDHNNGTEVVAQKTTSVNGVVHEKIADNLDTSTDNV